MSEQLLIEAVSRLQLQAGDKLILKLQHTPTTKQAERLRQTVEMWAPGTPLLILPPGIELQTAAAEPKATPATNQDLGAILTQLLQLPKYTHRAVLTLDAKHDLPTVDVTYSPTAPDTGRWGFNPGQHPTTKRFRLVEEKDLPATQGLKP